MTLLTNVCKTLGALLIGASAALGLNAQAITYFHNDISGSPMLATNASGNAVWKENYRPYGERLNKQAASTNNKLWFAGKPFDASTGLSYMGARYYDPVVGRFMGVDPVDYQESNIHSFNRYAYANNNPYKYVDRDGRYAELAVEVISLSMGYMSLRENMRAGNTMAAITDGVGMLADIVGAALPGVPGVAGLGIKASREAGEIAAKEAGVVANGIRGRASEARVLNELGLTKNTSAVSTAEGRSIPDALTKSLSVEVKDAANVSLTRQLRIQTEAARASGRESVLITGENTCVSGACSRAFDTIIRRSDLGPR
jgi:RHS repeat-associated protein